MTFSFKISTFLEMSVSKEGLKVISKSSVSPTELGNNICLNEDSSTDQNSKKNTARKCAPFYIIFTNRKNDVIFII